MPFEDGYFEKGIYYPSPKQSEEMKMIIKVELEGYDEVKAKLKDLIIDADLIQSATSRVISPDQQRLEV